MEDPSGNSIEPPESEQNPEIKQSRNPKSLRYYYRHRERILEELKKKKMEDPEYLAKMKAREDAKKAREDAKKAREEAKKAREEARVEAKEKAKELKRIQMAKILGILPVKTN